MILMQWTGFGGHEARDLLQVIDYCQTLDLNLVFVFGSYQLQGF